MGLTISNRPSSSAAVDDVNDDNANRCRRGSGPGGRCADAVVAAAVDAAVAVLVDDDDALSLSISVSPAPPPPTSLAAEICWDSCWFCW